MTSARAGSRRRATTLVVADDHPVVRDGLVGILQTQGDFSVVGTAASSTEAVEVCASARPDVAIIDLELPPADGVTAIEHIRRDILKNALIAGPELANVDWHDHASSASRAFLLNRSLSDLSCPQAAKISRPRGVRTGEA